MAGRLEELRRLIATGDGANGGGIDNVVDAGVAILKEQTKENGGTRTGQQQSQEVE